MHRLSCTRVAVALAIAALVSRDASAQAVVTALSGLALGTIISGTTTSVTPIAAGAMSLDINGILGASGGWSLTLPSTLTRAGGGATMAITFCPTCGRYRVNNNNPAGGVIFNPATGVTGLVLNVVSHVYVWIGASVSPPLNQAPGSYTGTIVLTLAPII